MSAMLVAVLAWAVGGADGLPATPSSTSAVEMSESSLSGPALRNAIHEAFRQWARPTDEEAAQAAREFLGLYEQLGCDDQLASSQREHLQTRLRYRLLQLSDRVAQQIARDTRRAEDAGAKSVALPEGKGEPLAQQMGGFGPQGVRGVLGGGRGEADDNGPALVELIQTTVRPASWDVNGGPGSIYYWYPGRALVVRQMDEVHGELGGLLQQLHRAGQ